MLKGEVSVRLWRRLSWRCSCCSTCSQRVLRSRYGHGWGGMSPHAVPHRRKEGDPSFSIWSCGEPLSCVPHHGRCGDSGPPWAKPMTTVSELPPMGLRLRPPKRSAMNLILPKWMVSSREKSSHDKRSPPAATMSVYDGTIGTSRGKACRKSPFLACQLSVFFAPARYRVVKIARSYSKMVL
jgi:hypothetical protein